MLVSDYDNTFHIKDEDMEKNIKKANEFMKNNVFVIATGRSYDSYNNAKEKFNIKTNYIILNHLILYILLVKLKNFLMVVKHLAVLLVNYLDLKRVRNLLKSHLRSLLLKSHLRSPLLKRRNRKRHK